MNLFRLRGILRNLENGGTAGGAGAGAPAAGTGAPAGGAAAGAPGAAAAGAPGGAAAAGDEAWRNPAEIKANFVKVRALEAEVADMKAKLGALTPPAPGAKDPAAGAGAGAAPSAADITAQVTAAVTFNTALQFQQGLTDAQSGILRTLFDLEKPAADKVGGWLKDKLTAFGRTPVGADGKPLPPQQSQVRTDLGAPNGRTSDPSAQPSDPRLVDPAVWRGMSSEQRLKIAKDFKARSGGSGLMRNPNRK